MVSTRSGATYSASMAPAGNVPGHGDIGSAAAAFEQAVQQTAPAPAPAKVKLTQGFRSAEEASFHAFKKINKLSIKEDREYVANVYCYKRSKDSEEEDRFGYTGPIPGNCRDVYVADPAILPPPGTKIVGDLHTHGRYQEYDPETGAPTAEALLTDKFSSHDIFNQIGMVFGEGETPEQRNERIESTFGVLPVDIDKAKFFLAVPCGDWFVHEPGLPATRPEDFPRTHTGEVIEDGGRIERLGRLP